MEDLFTFSKSEIDDLHNCLKEQKCWVPLSGNKVLFSDIEKFRKLSKRIHWMRSALTVEFRDLPLCITPSKFQGIVTSSDLLTVEVVKWRLRIGR